MRALALSLFLAASLAAPASAGRVASLTACGGYSKLDLGCAPPSSAPLLTVRSGDPRYAGNALTIRFGGPSRPRQGKFEAFLGGFGPRALFLAAVILALL